MLTQFTEFITQCLGCLSSCRIPDNSSGRLPSNPAPSSLSLLWLKPLVEFLYQKLSNVTHLLSLGVTLPLLKMLNSILVSQPFGKLRLAWLLGWWGSTMIHETTAVQLNPALQCLSFMPANLSKCGSGTWDISICNGIHWNADQSLKPQTSGL